MAKSKPIKRIRSGAVTLTVWECLKTDGSGTYNRYTVDRSYKRGDEWKRTNFLSGHDLKRAQMLMNKALESIKLDAEDMVVEDLSKTNNSEEVN